MKIVQDGQLSEIHPVKVTSRFWLVAGAALLTWQINDQVVQADTVIPEHPTVNVSTKVMAGTNSGGS